MTFQKQTYELFKPIIAKYFKNLKELELDLRRSRLKTPPEEWVALSLFASIVAFVAAFTFVLIFSLLLSQKLLLVFAASLGIAVVSALFAFLFMYNYPKLTADERKKKIENALPFATLYLAALSRAGLPPNYMFKLLSRFKEYGELSKEAAKISSDTETLGLDITEALTRAIARSPSPTWTELLAGIKTTLTIGGDVGDFLNEKANGFVEGYSRKLQEFSSFLSLLIEIYITLIITGAIFFIIISSVMSSIGAVPVSLLKAANILIVGVGIPMLTAMFIIVAKGVSPLED